MLRQNSAIWMPPIKELHFFDHIHIEQNRSWTLGHIRKGVVDNLKWHVQQDKANFDHLRYLIDLGSKNPFTEEWYRACYDRPAAQGKILGDITPEYSTLPDEGVRHVKELLGPELRIIYIIRNPVQRAISQLKMNLTRRGQENNNEEFWLNAAKDPVICQRGDYRSYIPRWESCFGASQILYIPYQQVRKNPLALLRNVEDHLHVANPFNYSNPQQHIHKTKEAVVPESCVRYFQEILRAQEEFIIGHFGKDFAGMT